MQTDGLNSRPLASAAQGGYEYACDLSPDGRFLAYVRRDDVSEDHYRLRILSLGDSSESVFLKDLTILKARWSNSGNFLYCNTGSQLIKAKVAGNGNPKVVYNFHPVGLEFRSFDISPDQKLIVYDDSGPERDGNLILDTMGESQIPN
jgi:dipeptidyl aminopeptidase/acylaminoacyl peptidase